jgi:integrase
MSKPHKLPSGRWRIQWLDSYGIRRSDTFDTFDTARAALRRREIEVDEIRAGRSRPRSDMTLRDASVDWIASRKPAETAAPDVKRRRGRRVRDNQRHLDHHILPELGELRLPDVNAERVQKFIQQLEGKRTARKGEKNAGDDARTLKPATIANVIITLRKMLNDLGYPIRVAYKVPESGYGWIKAPADVARFLASCSPTWFRMSCELAVYAGLRQGEVAGLRWDRVDFDRGLIQVDRSYDGPTKSKHVRAVPLAPELAASLKRWRLATGAAGGGLVVTMETVDEEGEPTGEREPIGERTDMGKRTRRACAAAGVDPVTFHQLRHTFASHLAERVALPVVGAVLGHADPKTTARYAHVDTASLARDPRLHLTFAAPAGEVAAMPDAHALHTNGAAVAADRAK